MRTGHWLCILYGRIVDAPTARARSRASIARGTGVFFIRPSLLHAGQRWSLVFTKKLQQYPRHFQFPTIPGFVIDVLIGRHSFLISTSLHLRQELWSKILVSWTNIRLSLTHYPPSSYTALIGTALPFQSPHSGVLTSFFSSITSSSFIASTPTHTLVF